MGLSSVGLVAEVDVLAGVSWAWRLWERPPVITSPLVVSSDGATFFFQILFYFSLFTALPGPSSALRGSKHVSSYVLERAARAGILKIWPVVVCHGILDTKNLLVADRASNDRTLYRLPSRTDADYITDTENIDFYCDRDRSFDIF